MEHLRLLLKYFVGDRRKIRVRSGLQFPPSGGKWDYGRTKKCLFIRSANCSFFFQQRLHQQFTQEFEFRIIDELFAQHGEEQ